MRGSRAAGGVNGRERGHCDQHPDPDLLSNRLCRARPGGRRSPAGRIGAGCSLTGCGNAPACGHGRRRVEARPSSPRVWRGGLGPQDFQKVFAARIPVQSTGRGRLGACEPGGPSCRSRSPAPIPVDWVVEILNERDREILPSRFMKSLCQMDQDAIRNSTSNEFQAEDLWTELGGYNFERVYLIVEDYFLNLYHCIVKHPNGKISPTNAGRKSLQSANCIAPCHQAVCYALTT